MSLNRLFRAGASGTSRVRRPLGISLIELLVVVAIIALLFSVVFPQMGRARGQGKIVRCCSNLRQVNIYHGMYLTQEDWPTWHLGFNYNGGSFSEVSEFIYGGFQAPQLDPNSPGGGGDDFYVLPTDQRPLNAVI